MNRNFQAPPVVLNLIIINGLFFMAMGLVQPARIWLVEHLGLFNPESPLFHTWPAVTYMFLHGDFWHLFFNMFALWMFGRTLEHALGSQRFLTYFMACGIGAALLQMGVGWLEYRHVAAEYGTFAAHALLRIPTVGASGAVFGLLLAFGVLYPNAVILLMFPPIPMKAKWFVVVYGLIELFLGVSGGQPGVAHFAHVGGMLWGLLLLWWWKRRGIIRF